MDGCPLQDHLLSLWYLVSTWQALSPRRPEWTWRAFHNVINKWPFQDHLFSTTLLVHRALSPSRWSASWEIWTSIQRLPCISDKCPSKGIFWVYGTDLMSTVSPDTWRMNLLQLPCVSDECPLQDHLMSLWYQHSKLHLPGDLKTEKLKMQRLPQCHWKQPFKDHLWVQLYWQIELLSPWRSEQLCTAFPMSMLNALYKSNWTLWYWWQALSLKRPEWVCRDFPVSVMNVL